MEFKINILIGSCGGLTGFYLLKELKNNYPKCKVYGFDSNIECASKIYLDKIIKAPLISEKFFISFLIKTLNNNNIDVYIPTLSQEIKLVAKYKEDIIKHTKSKFLISPYKSIEILETKNLAYEELKKIGVIVPKIIEDKLPKFPIFIKPKYGSGSKSSFKINDIEEYKFYKNKYPNSFFSEYLEGTEYSIDSIFDGKGRLISYNQRIRKKVFNGAVIVSQNNFDYDFKNIIKKISSHYKICGVANFQFILSNEIPYLIDINLRFASGGLPLSIKSNLNILELIFKILFNIPFSKEEYQSDKKNRIMYRYYEEFYEEN